MRRHFCGLQQDHGGLLFQNTPCVRKSIADPGRISLERQVHIVKPTRCIHRDVALLVVPANHDDGPGHLGRVRSAKRRSDRQASHGIVHARDAEELVQTLVHLREGHVVVHAHAVARILQDGGDVLRGERGVERGDDYDGLRVEIKAQLRGGRGEHWEERQGRKEERLRGEVLLPHEVLRSCQGQRLQRRTEPDIARDALHLGLLEEVPQSRFDAGEQREVAPGVAGVLGDGERERVPAPLPEAGEARAELAGRQRLRAPGVRLVHLRRIHVAKRTDVIDVSWLRRVIIAEQVQHADFWDRRGRLLAAPPLQ
mmetsp:Transcript_83618/g.255524  ORF Transcript_83618/g.255524 Transcript_83618/m.255524 type:complete len:312 (+) Transcript_83618:715-1650(+)